MDSCDSYIVRIYRRDAENPAVINGLVEVVETGEVKRFACDDELSEILCARIKKAKKGRRAERR
jgi:DNA-binding TFAR19-related protein (PDSD5 family)